MHSGNSDGRPPAGPSPVSRHPGRCRIVPPRRLLAAGGCVATVVVLAGCGRSSSGLDVHPVAGRVTIDGQPVESGLITFNGVSGDQRGFAARIERGAYAAKTFAGPMRVSITAQREVPGRFIQAAPDQPEVPVREQYIPARYNESTELEADVPRGGVRDLNFDLQSGAKR